MMTGFSGGTPTSDCAGRAFLLVDALNFWLAELLLGYEEIELLGLSLCGFTRVI